MVISQTMICIDALMKVSVDTLTRVYEALQEQGDYMDENTRETLDPEGHLFVVDAFDMPLWNWSVERSSFEK